MNSIKIQGKLRKIIAESTRTKEDRSIDPRKLRARGYNVITATYLDVSLWPVSCEGAELGSHFLHFCVEGVCGGLEVGSRGLAVSLPGPFEGLGEFVSDVVHGSISVTHPADLQFGTRLFGYVFVPEDLALKMVVLDNAF